MSYCTVREVASDFKNIVFDSTSSSVTEAEVQAIIDQECAYINARICHLYTTPVLEGTSPVSFMVLKRINIFLAADRVRHILFTKTGRDKSDQDTKGLRSLSRNPKTDLMDIFKGKLKLGDAVALNECIGFDTGFEVNDCFSSNFDVNKQQW
jgi:hypothetical protein